MAASLSGRVRPRVFFGRVPKGVGTADICKEIVKRFTLSELKCVQDFGLGRFEVTFATEEACRRFLDDPVLVFRDAKIRFDYRGVRVKRVRVLGFPADGDDRVLQQLLGTFGKVLELTHEHVPGFEGVLNGVRVVRLEMATAVPNLIQLRDLIIQCEYEGVVRICRRCHRTGHHAVKCTVPQCVRCGEYGHDQCARKCKHCGGDHDSSACKARSSAAPPVASSSSQEQVSGVVDDREVAPKDAGGPTLPQQEPSGEGAPGGDEREAGSKSAEALSLIHI